MTTYTIQIIIRIAVALVMAIVFGNGAVVMFNRLPVDWFKDYKEGNLEERVLPDKLLKSIEEGRQRIPSTPWKIVFTGFFGIAGVYLAVTDVLTFQIAAILVLAIVLEMAISDALYHIVPDQFSILLAISSVGFITFHENWWEPAAGAGIAALLMLATWGLGKLIYKKETIGGADIKFFLAIGCVTGRSGAVAIFLLTAVFNGIWACQKRFVQKQKTKMLPMLPPAWLACAVYMLFLWNRLQMINL